MDAFKQNEILRMQHGGNKAWQDFYNSNIGIENGGKSFEDSSIKERYESDVGDEWKERLSAKVEDRDFDRETWKKEREAYKARAAATNTSSRSQTPTGSGPRKGVSGIVSSTNTNTTGRSESPASRSNPSLPLSQKEQKEAYFSQLGAANASRPDHLPPSQGGRLGGFGNSPPPNDSSQAQESQADPIATLTQSFSWFTTSLSRTAKTVNETYIQPTAGKIASSDLAAQARAAAMQAGTGIQSTAKSATESFNRFVEGQEPTTRSAAAAGAGAEAGASSAKKVTEPERKDFWDSFGAATTSTSTSASAAHDSEKPKPKPSSIGTAAMKTGGNGEGLASAPLGSAAASTKGKGKGAGEDDGWDDW